MSKSIKGGDIRDDRSASNLLTKDMKRVLSRAEVGDKVWYKNIKAISPEGNERSLESIYLKVIP